MPLNRNTPIRSNPCKECGSKYHTRAFCPKIARTPIKKTMTVIRPSRHRMKRSRLKKIGKKGSRWQATKRRWFAENPPDEYGYYQCEIKPCLVPHIKIVAPTDPRLKEIDSGVEITTLDHKIPRSKRPDLIHVLSNLQPAHGKCNEEKKSRVDEDYDTYGKVQRRRQTEAWLFVMHIDDLAVRYLELLDMLEDAEDDVIIRDLQHEIDFIDELKRQRQK